MRQLPGDLGGLLFLVYLFGFVPVMFASGRWNTPLGFLLIVVLGAAAFWAAIFEVRSHTRNTSRR